MTAPLDPGAPGDARPRHAPPAEGAAHRPLPAVPSLLGVIAGLLLLSSLAWFLESLGDDARWPGLGLSVLFELVGVGLLVLHGSRRAVTAGVTLTALGVVPLVVFLFLDVDDPSNTVDSASDFTRTATLMLLFAAVAWLAAYAFGPSRRYGTYLAGALVALWLVAVVQVLDSSFGEAVDGFSVGAGATFEQVDPLEVEPFDDELDSGSFDDEFDSGSFEDDFDSGSFDDEFDSSFEDDFGYTESDDPVAELGVVSLLFGGSYLALAGWRDRRRDHHMATPLFAVAAPVLTLAVLWLSDPIESEGAAVLALALGAVAIWLGTGAGRRFTAWYGVFAAWAGMLVLVDSAAGDSSVVMGIVLLVLGVAVAVVAGATERGRGSAAPGDGPPSVPGSPGPAGQTWTPPGPSQPWSPPDPASPPWGTAPPTGPAGPTTAEAPAPGAPPPGWAPPGQTPPQAPPGP